MSWNKVKQFLFKNKEPESTKSTNRPTEGEETVEELEIASGFTNSEAEANTETNAASLKTTEDKHEATDLNVADDDRTENNTTREESFDENQTEERFSWDEAIHRHREFLVDRIFTEFGLLDKLYESYTISYKKMQKIKKAGVFYKRNQKLLDIILKKNKHELYTPIVFRINKQHELIEALKKTGQAHLVNYLKTDGTYDAEFSGEWPLNDYEIETLQRNRGILVDLLETCDLLIRMYETGVINKRQQEFIYSKRTSYKKNEALLDILRRSSLISYWQTIRCLHASNQSHVAEILEKGIVVVRIDARIQGKAIAVKQAEDEIAAGITNLLGNRSLPESNRIWELVKLNLIAARQGHSVALYFACHQLSDVDRLQQMTKDGRLKETIEIVFNRLILTLAKIRFQVKLISPDFTQCLPYLKDIMKPPKSDNTITDIQLTSMINLPFEVLDSILLKSCLQLYAVKNKQLWKNEDSHVITRLAFVDYCWFQRIRRKKFKKEIWRSLVGFHKQQDKASSVFKINRQYLEENLRLQGLVNKLKSSDCLTDVQAASLYRQNLPLGKKDSFKRFQDIISEVVKKKKANHSVFRRSLCDTRQHLIAEVIENGGAVAKVEIKFQKDKTMQIVERINEIRDETKVISHQIEDLMGKLREHNLEILSACQDGDAMVVWIWCKTIMALEKLKNLNKSKHIIDVLNELVMNLAILSEERNPAMIIPKVNIDFEQFEKTIVLFFSFITSRLDLGTSQTEFVRGLTKLRNKIHVLLEHLSSRAPTRCAILVFEDQIPFCLQKRIEIKEIKKLWDIASIERENSLYVLDLGRCVWKIKGEGDEQEKNEKIIIKWLELRDWSVTLSVTRDGQLLFVGQKKGDPWCSLFTFGGGSEKAELSLSIPLPEDIQSPRHAMETSKGNFIISHQIKRKKEDESGSDGGILQKEEEIWVVSEVSGDGKTIIRRFIPENEGMKFGFGHLAIVSFGRVFLTDMFKDRVILLDSDLQWNGILIPTEEDLKEGRKVRRPWRLFYDEEKKDLIVGGFEEVFVFALNRK